MKKALLAFLLLSFSLHIAIAQNYQGYVPFPKKSVYWLDKGEDMPNQHNTPRCINNQYVIEKDTVINSNTYQVIKKTTIDRSTPAGCGPPFNATQYTTRFGYIRNDSLNKKVWLRLPNASTDTLFYDFDLEVGDTLKDFYMASSYAMQVVDSIDTVLLGNRYRKKLYTSSPSGCFGLSNFLIEGIGASTGFAFSLGSSCPLHGTINKLNCQGDDSGSIYVAPNANCILSNLTSNTRNSTQELSIFPNPVHKSFSISDNVSIHDLTLFSVDGKKVNKLDLKKSSWELPSKQGIYFLRIETTKGEVITKKLVKH